MHEARIRQMSCEAYRNIGLEQSDMPKWNETVKGMCAVVTALDPSYKVCWAAMVHVMASSVADWAVRRSGATDPKEQELKAIATLNAIRDRGVGVVSELCSKPTDAMRIN